MIIAGYDFSRETEERFIAARQALQDFIEFTPEERDRLSRRQEAIAYSFMREGPEARKKRLATEMEDLDAEALRLVAREYQSFAPIRSRLEKEMELAKAKARAKVDEHGQEDDSKQGKDKYDGAENYSRRMIESEKRQKEAAEIAAAKTRQEEIACDIAMLDEIIKADKDAARITLLDMLSVIVAAWQTRCEIDAADAYALALENAKKRTQGIDTQFKDSLPPGPKAPAPSNQNALPCSEHEALEMKPVGILTNLQNSQEACYEDPIYI